MTKDYKKLQKLEDELIQVVGLMEALQLLLPDGSAHSCVADELAIKINRFEQCFYEYWDDLSSN